MEDIRLTAEKRHTTGKGQARKTRVEGFLPGILYGPETEAVAILLKTRELEALLRKHGNMNMLINLDLADDKNGERKVLIRELQRDPVAGSLKHVDLYQVSMSKKITMSIKIHLKGTPEGVKLGGIIQHVIRDLEISCLPGDIPPGVEIDVSAMNIGDAIHVGNLSLDKVEILTSPNRTIVTVVPPTIIKEAVPTAAVAEGEAAAGEAAAGEGEAARKEGEEAKEEKEEKKEKKEKK